MNSRDCLNCGNPIDGRYCSSCGQKVSDYNYNLKELLKELFSIFIEFDKSVFKSLKLLIKSPVSLVYNYLEGKRVSFINPFKLFLSLAIIFFMCITIKDSSIKYIEKYRVISEKIERDSLSFGEYIFNDSLMVESIATEDSSTVPDSLSNDEVINFNISEDLKFKVKHDDVIANFYQYAPYSFLFMIPLTALMLKILYLRRGRLYFEHLIFSLTLHSLAFLLFIPSIFLDWSILQFLTLITISLYIFIGTKRFYKQGVIKTLIKLGVFLSAYLVVSFVVFITTFALSALLLGIEV